MGEKDCDDLYKNPKPATGRDGTASGGQDLVFCQLVGALAGVLVPVEQGPVSKLREGPGFSETMMHDIIAGSRQ